MVSKILSIAVLAFSAVVQLRNSVSNSKNDAHVARSSPDGVTKVGCVVVVAVVVVVVFEVVGFFVLEVTDAEVCVVVSSVRVVVSNVVCTVVVVVITGARVVSSVAGRSLPHAVRNSIIKDNKTATYRFTTHPPNYFYHTKKHYRLQHFPTK